MSTIIFLAALSIWADKSGPTLEEANAAVERVYAAAVSPDGRVDYGLLKKDADLMAGLLLYLDYAAQMDLDAFTDKNQKIAVLSNTYNVITLVGVTQAWPVASVRKISPMFGFFKRSKWDVAGRRMTLDDLENKHLRALDNRIHFLINCASGSCPVLKPVVLTRTNVEEIMEENTAVFLKDSTKNRFNPETRTFELSKIFKWFEDDWGDAEGVVAFVKKYRPELDWEPEKVVFLDYDWSLNGPTK